MVTLPLAVAVYRPAPAFTQSLTGHSQCDNQTLLIHLADKLRSDSFCGRKRRGTGPRVSHGTGLSIRFSSKCSAGNHRTPGSTGEHMQQRPTLLAAIFALAASLIFVPLTSNQVTALDSKDLKNPRPVSRQAAHDIKITAWGPSQNAIDSSKARLAQDPAVKASVKSVSTST